MLAIRPKVSTIKLQCLLFLFGERNPRLRKRPAPNFWGAVSRLKGVPRQFDWGFARRCDRSTPASLEVVFYYGVNSSYAVFPVNLLALRIRPAAVGDAHLTDPTASADEFGDNFRLNAEAIFFDLKSI